MAGILALGVVMLVTLLLTAFGPGSPSPQAPSPADAARLLPAGPPSPQIIAAIGSLRLQLPVPQSRLTAIGYHAAGTEALALQPLGRQANQGFLQRLFHHVFGGPGGGLRYYQLPGGTGPATGAVDVGAPAGTDVFAPVDGTVVGITDLVLDGRPYGVRVDIQPSGSPSLVVSLTHVEPDPGLTVGASVATAATKLGTVLDFSHVERQALAAHTQDAGNHVTIDVQPAATPPFQ